MKQTKKEMIECLDTMTRQYLITALWAETCSSQNKDCPDPLDEHHTIENFSKHSLYSAEVDCLEFRNRCRIRDIDLTQYDDGELGRDLWLTRNGHGAGFWDGDYPIDGETLTEIAESLGHVDINDYRKLLTFYPEKN